MRPLNSGSSSSVIRVWKSPVPYLFGGLAVMLALISAALVVLICSYMKRASQSSASAQEITNTKQGMPRNSDTSDSEPKVVVIMAGDNNPTYLANPTTSSTFCTCQPQPTPSLSSVSAKDQTATN